METTTYIASLFLISVLVQTLKVAGDDGNYTPTDQWPQCFTNPALRDQKICQLARSDPEKFVEFSQELAQKHPPSPTLLDRIQAIALRVQILASAASSGTSYFGEDWRCLVNTYNYAQTNAYVTDVATGALVELFQNPLLNIYQELTGVNCRSSPIVSGAFTCTTCYCQVVYMETTALVFTGNGLEVQWRRIKYPYKCALLW